MQGTDVFVEGVGACLEVFGMASQLCLGVFCEVSGDRLGVLSPWCVAEVFRELVAGFDFGADVGFLGGLLLLGSFEESLHAP